MKLVKKTILLFASILVINLVPALGIEKGIALMEGKVGNSIDLSRHGRHVSVELGDTISKLPVTYSFWAKLNGFETHNVALAVAEKTSMYHWEVYVVPKTGAVAVYMPQVGDFVSNCALTIGEWHFLAISFDKNKFSLYVDGKCVLERVSSKQLVFDKSSLQIGKVIGEPLGFNGYIDELQVALGSRDMVDYTPMNSSQIDMTGAVCMFHFDEISDGIVENSISSRPECKAIVKDIFSMPLGDHFLDEVQDEAYSKSTLHGDAYIEYESTLPVVSVGAKVRRLSKGIKEPSVITLDGQWLLKGCKTGHPARLNPNPQCAEESQGTKEGWYKYEYDRSDWMRVKVPTTVQNALLELGEIENPFWDTNTWDELHNYGEPKGGPWHHRLTRIEQQDWWFAREFSLSDDWENKKIRLYFDGIDYAGSIYLNGKSLGHHAGMFGGPSYDITDLVQFETPNQLVVRIDAVPEMWDGILKGSPGWGWHYGHMISLGIWRSVELQEVPEFEIQSPFVKTQLLKEDEAVLAIEYYVNSTDANINELLVEGVVTGKTFDAKPLVFQNQINVPYGKTRYQTEIVVKNPKLWWPMNYGDQDMYSLRLAVSSKKAKPIDSCSVDFGIRTIRKNPLYGAREDTDYRWQFVVNDVPMFIKGANWCWADPMLKCDSVKYEHNLELCRRAGIQMLRSWGGGIVETDEFYRLCDKKGIMIYQEFPFCWGPPDFQFTNAQVLDDQVSRVVKRLRNHPALVMWGGGNENVGIRGNDEGLFLVGRRCRQYDPTRPYHRTSPWGGSYHNWAVFHNGLPIDSGFMMAQFQWYGEFGLPSMTNWDETLKYLPKEKLEVWPPVQNDGGIIGHMNQFGYGDLVKVMRYCDYGPITSWGQYIEYSQMAQGDEISFAVNLQRSGSYLNKGGLWFYKISDLFPGHSWGVVGFYGHPKLSYYRAKQVCLPQAAFAHYEKYAWDANEFFRAVINVNNDSSMPLENVVVKAVIYGSDLKELWKKEYDVDSVAVSSRKELDRINVKLDPAKIKPFIMAVSMHDKNDNLISDQWYWFNFKAKTEAVNKMEDIQAWGWPHDRAPEAFDAYGTLPEARLLRLPKTQLSARIKREGKNGVIFVKNESGLPAFNVIIGGFPYDYGVYLADNSFSLYPYEERAIKFELVKSSQSLDGVSVKAWNAPKTKVR